MAWVKKFISDDKQGTTYDYHVIRSIVLPSWDRSVGLAGWGSGRLIVQSYISKETRLLSKEPFKEQEFLIDFTLFPGIDWNGQDNLLTWAYTFLKPYIPEMADAEEDLTPSPTEIL